MRALATILHLALVALMVTSCYSKREAFDRSCYASVPMQGWMQNALESNSVIVMGELHGTSQTPRAFNEAVCAAARHGYSLAVGIEVPEAAVDAVRTDLAYGGSAEKLTDSTFWMKARDGRSSQANYELIKGLVALEKDSLFRVVGFDVRITGREPFGSASGDYIRDMLGGDHEKWKVLLLTGRGHSGFGADPNSVAANFVESGMSTIAVTFQYGGGEAWVCRRGECGPSLASNDGGCEMPAAAPSPPIALGPNQKSAAMCLGKVTSSPPKMQ